MPAQPWTRLNLTASDLRPSISNLVLPHSRQWGSGAPRLVSAKIAADRSISGDHGRWPVVPTVPPASSPTVWEQSSARFSQKTKTRRPPIARVRDQAHGAFLQNGCQDCCLRRRSRPVTGDKPVVPWSPESHMPVSRMQRHEQSRSRGLLGSGAPVLRFY